MHTADVLLLALAAVLALVFRRGLVSDGYGFDRAVAALCLRAKRGETMSTMVARAERGGRRWGCIGCWLLDRLVEPDHCGKALDVDGAPTAVLASYRAGALLLALAAAAWAVPWAIGRFL